MIDRFGRIVTLGIALPLSIACGGQQARPGATEQRAEQRVTDAEIAAVLEVANQSEVEQARLAREKAEEQQVQGFATAMLSGHTAAAQQHEQLIQRRGITPQESALSRRLREQSMQAQQRLEMLSGAEFDRAYMQAQMQQHRELLSLLDQQLIPNAQDPQYRQFLEQLRQEIAGHLNNAERIQAEVVG